MLKKKCLICKKEYDYLSGSLSRHIKNVHNMSLKKYYINVMNEKIIKCSCGKDCKFVSLTRGFKKSCGDKKCHLKVLSNSAKNKPPCSDETKKKISKIHKGKKLTDSHRKNISIAKTNNPNTKWSEERKIEHGKKISKWLKDNPEEMKKRIKNWGRASTSDTAKEKRINTLIKKYGVTNSFQTERALKNHKKTFENYEKIEKINQKRKNNKKEKYGDENWNNSDKQSKTLRNKFNRLKTNNIQDKNFYLYIISDNKGLLKIGVTEKLNKRLKDIKYTFSEESFIIDSYFGNFNEVYKLETFLHNKYDKYNIILKEGNGRTEWFDNVIIENLKKDIKEIKNGIFTK